MTIIKFTLTFLFLSVIVSGYYIPENAPQQYQRKNLVLQNKFGEESENQNLSPDYQDNENNSNLTAQINQVFNSQQNDNQANLENQFNLDESEQDDISQENQQNIQNFNQEDTNFHNADNANLEAFEEKQDRKDIQENQQTFQDFNQENNNFNNVNQKENVEDSINEENQQNSQNFNQDNSNLINVQENQKHVSETNRNNDFQESYDPDFESFWKPVSEPNFVKQQTFLTEEKNYKEPKENVLDKIKNWFSRHYKDIKHSVKHTGRKIADAGRHAWKSTKEFFTPKAKEETHYEYYKY